ncbi:hypothetical protein DYB37_005767 [Aphanomyces astaci]|uniref:CASTOR/POLLUX/SYM8 ion channel conserved domain-containing protein n=1 Tax=Aphanomyces astaci TaxID=112090 RepID=A0A418FAH5_APHAT|nr:hypothetical protein DYB37_005767 [Aphanomyces astaci]
MISTKKGQTIGLLLFWVFLDMLLIPYEAFAYQAQGIALPRCIYEAVMDTLDPKSDDDGQGTMSFLWTLRSLSVMVCLVCTMYVNVIFGVIVDGIVSKMETLKEGKGAVVETNHTLMLGWNDNSLSFIREICAANESEGGGVIVVLSMRDKVDLEAEIYHVITDWKGTRLVCCCGNPLLTTDLLRVSAPQARSITIMSSDEQADVSDAALLRTLLVIKSMHGLQGHVVADVGDVDNNTLLQVVAGDILETVDSHNIIGRLVIMCSRSPHLSDVYNAVLGFDGNEFYFKAWPDLVGLPFGQLASRFDHAIPIVWIRPYFARVIEPGDEIIVLAEDDNTYTAATEPVDSTPVSAMTKRPLPTPPKRILLCGWHRDIRDILRLLNHLSVPNTEVDLVNEVPEDIRIDRLRNDGLDVRSLENLNVRHVEANVAIRRQAQHLRVPQYDCILVMSDSSNQGLASDSLVLASVVMLRAIEVSQRSHKSIADLSDASASLQSGRHVHCVSEILDPRTEMTINSSHTIRCSSDYVMSNDLVSRMLAMVSENRNVNAILDELLGDKGSTFDVLPASRYCEMNERLSFWQLAKRASTMYEEVLCGYVNSKQPGSPVVLNPTDKALVRTWGDYSMIVIREAMSKSKLNRFQSHRLMVKVVRRAGVTNVNETDSDDENHEDETRLPRLMSPAANGRKPSIGLRQCSTSDSLMDEVVRDRLTVKMQRNSFNSSGYHLRVEAEKLAKLPPSKVNYRRLSSSEKDNTAVQPFLEESPNDILSRGTTSAGNALVPILEGDATPSDELDQPHMVPLMRWHDRWWYLVDTFISTNQGQAILLVVVCVVMAFSLGPIVQVAGHNPYGDSVWRVWTYMTDTGTQNHAETHEQKAVAFFLTIIGFVYFAVVVAFVVDSIREKMDQLKHGRTTVVEINHTLLLGWSDKAIPFIQEICHANESEGGGVVVVLADMSNERMAATCDSQGWPKVGCLSCFGSIEPCRSFFVVYATLLGFSGNEFYFEVWPECVGVPFALLTHWFRDAIPIGYRDVKGHVHLLPAMGHRMQPGEALLVLAEDNDSYKPKAPDTASPTTTPTSMPTVQTSKADTKSAEKVPTGDLFPPPMKPKTRQKILVCGWRRDLRDMLRLLDTLSAPGTVVYLLNEVSVEARVAMLLDDGMDLSSLSNISLVHLEGNAAVRRHVSPIQLHDFDSYIVVCDASRESDILASDSHVLATVLVLRSVEIEQQSYRTKQLFVHSEVAEVGC